MPFNPEAHRPNALDTTAELLAGVLPRYIYAPPYPQDPNQDPYHKLHELWPLSETEVLDYDSSSLQEELEDSLQDMVDFLGSDGRRLVLDQARAIGHERKLRLVLKFKLTISHLDEAQTVEAAHELVGIIGIAQALIELLAINDQKAAAVAEQGKTAYARWIAHYLLTFNFIPNQPQETSSKTVFY